MTAKRTLTVRVGARLQGLPDVGDVIAMGGRESGRVRLTEYVGSIRPGRSGLGVSRPDMQDYRAERTTEAVTHRGVGYRVGRG